VIEGIDDELGIIEFGIAVSTGIDTQQNYFSGNSGNVIDGRNSSQRRQREDIDDSDDSLDESDDERQKLIRGGSPKQQDEDIRSRTPSAKPLTNDG